VIAVCKVSDDIPGGNWIAGLQHSNDRFKGRAKAVGVLHRHDSAIYHPAGKGHDPTGRSENRFTRRYRQIGPSMRR